MSEPSLIPACEIIDRFDLSAHRRFKKRCKCSHHVRGKIFRINSLLKKTTMQTIPIYDSAKKVPHALQELQEAVGHKHLIF
jgi:hypothetical protein